MPSKKTNSEKKKLINEVSDSALPEVKGNKKSKQLENINSDEISDLLAKAKKQIEECKTHREILELQIQNLAECVALATELYKDNPIPDNGYQLTSLVSAHRTALTQLEKMKDPEMILRDIEQHIMTMFRTIVRAMALEIDKTKKDMIGIYPDGRTTIDDLFTRMLNAIQPETQNIYDDLRNILKKILGIKK